MSRLVKESLENARGYYKQRSLSKALQQVNAALSVAEGRDLVLGHLQKGAILITMGRYRDKQLFGQALDELELARRLNRDLKAERNLGFRIDLALGEVLSHLKQYEEAESFFKGVMRCDHNDMDHGEHAESFHIKALLGLSHVAGLRNDFTLSLDFASEGLRLFNENGLTDMELKTEVYFQVSQAYNRRRDHTAMEAYMGPVLEWSRESGDTEKEALALCNLAAARCVQSDYVTAMPMFIESLQKSRHIGFRNSIAFCLINIGTTYAQLFNYEEALDRYHTVLSEYVDAIEGKTRIIIENNLGNIYYTIGNYEESLAHFREALRLANTESYKDKEMIAHVHSQKCRVYLAMNRTTEAREDARLAAILMAELGGAPSGKQIHLLNLSELELRAKNWEQGKILAKKGVALAKRYKDNVSELRGFNLLSKIYRGEKDFEKAFRCQSIFSEMQAEYANTQRNMRMIDLEIKYSLLEKQRRIEELTKENAYQALLLEQGAQMTQQNTQLLQANEELRQFAYITSHDLKEPLRMIGSFTQIIEKQYASKLGEESKVYFRYVSEGVTRMNGLLDGLLQYATIGRTGTELDRVDMNDVLRLSCANLKLQIEETNTQIMFNDLPVVRAVQSLLIQLLQNLIGNAIKFNKPDVSPVIKILSEDDGDCHLFKVVDNGIGIDPEHRERVFVIFQRLHTRSQYEGTGIGLAICQKIVQKLGGKIWVESGVGAGASFCFTIPK